MNEYEQRLIAQHAHGLREIAKRVDLLEIAKRIESGEWPATITSEEQAQQLVDLLRATRRYVDDVEAAVPK